MDAAARHDASRFAGIPCLDRYRFLHIQAIIHRRDSVPIVFMTTRIRHRHRAKYMLRRTSNQGGKRKNGRAASAPAVLAGSEIHSFSSKT
ncbi:hypothetical protein [Burkholderia gladioli]|uniref:hypothetical protein n=1 Tax=Burkholderia gladioli TaxID=28095 RepID=UPI0012D938E4|nr:hypothetical protein [Burkholderia gladioli]